MNKPITCCPLPTPYWLFPITYCLIMEEVNEGTQGMSQFYPALMGQAAGAIKEVKTAEEIVQEMMHLGL